MDGMGGMHALPAMLCRGVGMPRPHEFYTPNRRGISLPCVGGGGTPLGVTEGVYGSNLVGGYRPSELRLPCVGVVPRAANENLYDCRWQSYLYYVAARKGSRRGCTVGSCRRLSNGGFQRIDSLHPLSHGLWPVTAPPTQGSQRLAGSFYFTRTAPSMRLSIHSRRGR